MKQWKRLAALSSAIVMAAATLTYFPNDTLQNIRLEISASADETSAGTTTEPQVWIEDNLTWTLDADGTLTISGIGKMKNYNSSDNQSPVCKNSNVKKVVIEDGVTSIGDHAFRSCNNLTSITIPDSVTSIGDSVFSFCGHLTSITISDSVISIGNLAFSSCWNLTSITIPDSVISIGNLAFSSCWNLTSITIPDSVISIGNRALSNCSSLTSITIPDSVTSIGIEVFQKCTSLKTISLSCKSTLKKSDFGGQADLVSYTPHTLTKTEAKDVTCAEDGNKEYWTCEHCGKYFLSDDTDPETATAVEQAETILPAIQHKNATTRGAVEPNGTKPGYSGDRYCPDCDTVLEKGYTYWVEGNLTWKLDADGTLTISGTGAMKNYKDGNQSPVFNNSNVKKVVIEDGVTSIGNYAFSYTDLKSITIPDRVTSIGNYAFAYCKNLPSITIPDSVTSIGNYAFSNCRSLTSITIPDSVTSIGNDAFYGCSSLKTISLSCKSSLKKSDFGGQADLVSYTSHTLTKTEAKAATCTEDGNKEYWTCEHCGKYFLSDDTNPETAKAIELSETVIPASHKLTKVDAKDATCTESGNKEYWTCEHCGKYFLSDDTNSETAKAVELSETVIPALKHKNATTRGAVKPTETEPGYSGDRYCPDCNTILKKGYTYWNEGNLTWKLDADGTLTISGTGAMKNYNYYNNPSPASQKKGSVKKVVIKDGVTSIGNSAFDSCSNLTSITIPDSVTSIGNHAFYACSSLPSITIPDNVTRIGDYAFYACSSLPSITIPDSVTRIGDYAFYDCSSLPSITIPDDVTSIGNCAFESCSNLTSIVIPNSVTSIGYGAFKNCKSLTSIKIPSSVTSIGNFAFRDCKSLTSITIPDSVTSIGNYAFYDCSSLTSITIPDSVTSIGEWAFSGCSSLPSITIPDSVTSIEYGAFHACSSLTSITIPDGVTSIGYGTFHTCSSLTSITIPDSVTSIGNYAFYDCKSLTSITIPDSVTSIEESAFENCSNLTSITIPKSVTSIENGVFHNCNNLTVYLESGSTLTSNDLGVDESKIVSYWNEDNLTWKLDAKGTLTISGTGAMKDYDNGDNLSPVCNNSNVKKVVIEDGVTSIGDYAFRSCNNLTSIMISNSVTSIGNSAFFYCTSLTSITIPDNVTSIENYAFAYTGLKSITIPDSVTNIGNYAFAGCKDLTSITIPDSVTSIGNYAFYNCSSLTSITIPDSVTSIGTATFSGCKNLTSITIPDSVTSIGNSAFVGCKNLTSITIPDSVTSIGESTFKYCSNLKTISLSCKSSLKRNDFGEQADLVSYTNQHLLTKTAAKDATCTEDGNKEYWTCEHCGKYFLSDDTNPETAKAVEQSETVIPASHKLTKAEAKAATCTEDGNKEYWTCEHCGKYFLSDDTNPETAKAVELSEITIPPIKHSYDKNGFCKNDDTHYQPASYNEESEKYEISNAGQLYWFAEQVNSGNASLNAVLTTDIVVNETVLAADGSLGADPDTLRMWRSIGDDDTENIFKGTFDGQGHTISGLYFSNDSNESDVICASLFGFSAGIIQNVGLEDSYFNYYYAKIDGQLIVNGMAAGICAINNGQIVNCYNAGTILGYCASGICVINSDNGSIENCYNTGVIRGSWLVAGICNMNAGSMKDCYNNNSDITVMTDSTIIDENDEISYASGICNNNGSSGRIENCYHVGQVSGADVNNNICNLNAGQIENSYYDCNICNKDAITQNKSSAVAKNVEGKTTKQFASGEVTYLLNGDQSVRAFYQNLAKEKYPTLNQKSKVVMQLEMIYDESFGEDATTNKTYHNAGDTIALETSPDKAYTYQYFVNGKQIEESNYTLTGNTKMTVKRVPVEIELSEINTIQLTYQKKTKLDLTEYLKNFADLKPVQFQLDADSKLPEGLTLEEGGTLSGIPEKAAENVKTTLILTAKNGTTKNMELTFHIAKAEPTVEVAISGDSHTEGDLVRELKLILSENSTKGVVELVSEIKALVAGKNTFTWKFTPEDENNYNMVTGTVVVNAKATTTTTTTTTKATTTTTKATTTTKPNKTTTTKVTTTTKPNKTTTTKVTTTTKPSKTTTINVTTTTKPSKTTTTKATTTTKPSKTTTTNVTTTTKPSKTTTTKATTTTKPSKTTITKVTTTTKPSKTTTTNATTTTKPSKTTTTNATTTTKPSKTTTTNATTTTKPSKTTTTNATTTTKPSKTTTTKATTTNTAIPSYGDVNLDGKVDILDAVYLNKYLATLIQFSDVQIANADCYQDGVLDDQDTTALMQFIILLIDDLPVQPTEK